MSERRVLILTQQHLAAYEVGPNGMRREHAFAADETGFKMFRDWLEQHRSARVHLLVDLADEGFHQETLPHVIGKDRKALLTRKLSQYFFGTPYTMVRSLGREKQGRRDEHFLFSALTRPQALEPWLQALHETGIAIAGIHSPALLLNRLLDRQTAEMPRLILITLGSGGLRQSYFEHGQLRFSRLKPLTTDTIEEAAVNAYGEAVRIYQYLIGQRLLSRGNKVPVLCLASPAHFDLLRRACIDTDELSFGFASLSELPLARQLKLAHNESSIDPLLVNMLLRHSPKMQFGDADVRLDYHRWQWRNALHKAIFASLGLSLALVAAACFYVWAGNNRIADAQHAAENSQRQYTALVQSLPAIPLSPEQLRSLIGQWQQLKARAPDLAASLQPISAALEANPQIELKSLNWRLAEHPDDSTATAAPADWLVMDIVAQLSATIGADRRAQNESIDRFVNALATDDANHANHANNPNNVSHGNHARVLQRPFDTDSGKALRGNSEVYSDSDPLNFSVRYWRKLEP